MGVCYADPPPLYYDCLCSYLIDCGISKTASSSLVVDEVLLKSRVEELSESFGELSVDDMSKEGISFLTKTDRGSVSAEQIVPIFGKSSNGSWFDGVIGSVLMRLRILSNFCFRMALLNWSLVSVR